MKCFTPELKGVMAIVFKEWKSIPDPQKITERKGQIKSLLSGSRMGHGK